jgi:hypothetical protein
VPIKGEVTYTGRTAWAVVRKDIIPYYRTLGLNPGAEATEIRAAYRKMVQQWHPDLFKPGSPMQTTAEDITKEINEAYDQLYRKKLYRNFSPKSERKEKPQPPEEREAPTREGASASSEKRAASVPKAKQSVRHVRRKAASWSNWVRRFKWARWARIAGLSVAVLVFVLLGRMIVGSLPSWSSAKPASPESHAQDPVSQRQAAVRLPKPQGRATLPAVNRPAVAPAPAYPTASGESRQENKALAVSFAMSAEPPTIGEAASIDRAAALLDVIEIGDTKARVLAVQGSPDEMGDAIFRYGSSVVYFRDGRVSGWLDRYPRLHVRDWAALTLPSLDSFARGSSRGDVVRAQGKPEAFTAATYSYGTSLVFFDNDSVAGWSDGTMRLRNFEMPTLKFFDLDQIVSGRGVSAF